MTERPAEALYCAGCRERKIVGEKIDGVLCCEFCGGPVTDIGSAIDAAKEMFGDR